MCIRDRRLGEGSEGGDDSPAAPEVGGSPMMGVMSIRSLIRCVVDPMKSKRRTTPAQQVEPNG